MSATATPTLTQTEPPTPTWPSLYDPLIEFHNLEHRSPIQPGGRYLKHAGDVFRFTFYWTLIFNSLFFLTTGGIAFFNIIYPQRRGKREVTSPRKHPPQRLPHSHSMIPLTPVTSARSLDPFFSEPPETTEVEEPHTPMPRKNVQRSRVTYALFTLLTFLVTAVTASFIESAVVGYVLWAVCKAGDFNIST
ncbi:hypothetical protein B0F90DRAFT_1814815 [Multifurca ochricompacta]|uniref:Uncharacterized protein n=1 Tax=Multifurca ochricompacta TaxID=376703 RepID=A0AAD4M8X5_9AGAM|nr:hypothetical protein B0F90DRAFT_1814815 [Multifurca ochricompacta]